MRNPRMLTWVGVIPFLLVVGLLVSIPPVTSAQSSPCAAGTAVPDAANNPGLVADCDVLLAARDTLAGNGPLNWSASTDISSWDGVTPSGSPPRVTTLDRGFNQLTGTIPTELGNLANLEYLYLNGNQLRGCVPASLQNQLDQGNTDLGDLSYCASGVPNGMLPPAQTSPETDREALVALYNATGGESWQDNDNWLSDAPIGEWYGVSVDAEGRVVGLNLQDNLLSGAIPGELGNLTNLEHLSLSGNQLTGAIPGELGRLADLTNLSLGGNQLSGEIPGELGSLASLESLSLSGNQLSGAIPGESGNLTNLETLFLFSNQLTGKIPPELGHLANLEGLHLFSNQLSGEIPAELGGLANLDSLTLYGNRLEGCIPRGLEGVLSNYELRLLGLPFCAVPGAPTITALIVEGDNSLTIAWAAPTSGPAVIAYDLRYIRTDADETVGGNWTVVEDVWTGSGPLQYVLTGLAADTAYDIQMRAVRASGDGPWSTTARFSPHRAALVALYNATDGANWSNKTNWLSSAALGEWYGVSADSRGRVVGLSLGVNQFAIPGELGNLTNLEHLSLHNNQLSGAIPGELGRLTNLTYLDLGRNQLSGEIPAELGNLANLQGLHLFSNQLSGEIPGELGNLASLELLSLSGNQLSGTIPGELGNLTNLTYLNLTSNQLNGSIPGELGSLPNLNILYLDRNRLTGCVPAGLRRVTDNDFAQLGLPFCDMLDGRPVVVIRFVSAAGAPVRLGSPISLEATFSEPVTGFSLEDISVANGVASNFSGSGSVYAFEVTPNAIGEVAVDIAADVAEDADGNGNIAARLSFGIPYDDDGNGAIGKIEVIAAINDNLFGDGSLEKSHVIALINLYLFGGTP